MKAVAKPARVSLMLDSGAFSCWRRREKLSLKRYISFVQEHSASVYRAINLDVIPGVPGVAPTSGQVEEAAKASAANAARMRKEGINPIPVFHQGERLYWLDKMIADGYDYIGFSPRNDRTSPIKVAWLDRAFSRICGATGYPPVKVHGFGISVVPTIRRFPWASVDTTSWFQYASYGSIAVPYPATDEHFAYDGPQEPPSWDLTRDAFVLPVTSGRSATALPGSSGAKAHLSSLGPLGRQYVENYLASQNFNLPDLQGHYTYRFRTWCRFFELAFREYVPGPFERKLHLSGFFESLVLQMREGSRQGPFRFFYSAPISGEFHEVLEAEGCRNRLISYYEFMHRKGRPNLEHYVRTGVFAKKKAKVEASR